MNVIAARKLVGTLCLWIASSLIAKGVFAGIKNVMNGKDILGKKKVVRKETYVDYKGDVILGSNDYQIDPC